MSDIPHASNGSELIETARTGVVDCLSSALDAVSVVTREELAGRLQPATNGVQYANNCLELTQALATIPRLLRDPLAYPKFLGRLSVKLTECAQSIRVRSSSKGLSGGEAQEWYDCGEMLWAAATELAEWCAGDGEVI